MRKLFAIGAFIFSLSVSIGGFASEQQSDHFDGSRFFNAEPEHTFGDMLKWLWEMKTVPWPKWIEDPPQPPPPFSVEDGNIRITYINHATLLIQFDGLNILTDPIWSMRAGPTSWLGTKRVRSPGIALRNIPKIDCILISHDHFDHLDLPTIAEIAYRDHPMFYVGLGIKKLLLSTGIKRVHEMDWWDDAIIENSNTRITFVPARHGSGRAPLRENVTLWGGFILESQIVNIYFAGDTGYGKFFESIHERFPKIDLAILPIGSYEKRWFMKSQHLNPDDAVRTHLLLGAKQSVGCHYATFAEHPEQTIDAHERDLALALQSYSVPSDKFWILKFGEGREIQ